MTSKPMRRVLALVISFSVLVSASSVVALAQQPSAANDEAQIKSYRSQIRVLVENAPSAGSAAEADYNAAVLSLRRKLRDLLVEKRGAWKSKIGNLQPLNSTPEIARVVTALQAELQTVESEVTGLDGMIGLTGSIASGPPAPSSIPGSNGSVPASSVSAPGSGSTSTPARATTGAQLNSLSSDLQKAFEAKVASLFLKNAKS